MNTKDINKYGSYEANIKRRNNLKAEFHSIGEAIVDLECNSDSIGPMTYRILEVLVDKRKKEIEEELLSLPEETIEE